MSNFENAIEVIGQAIFELLPPEDPRNDEARKNVNSLLDCTTDGYVRVKRSKAQELMSEEWFDDEAIFCSGAYFIPIKRII